MFKRFKESDSQMHVELGMGNKHVVKGFWNSFIRGGVMRHVKSDEHAMIVRTQKCSLNLSD